MALGEDVRQLIRLEVAQRRIKASGLSETGIAHDRRVAVLAEGLGAVVEAFYPNSLRLVSSPPEFLEIECAPLLDHSHWGVRRFVADGLTAAQSDEPRWVVFASDSPTVRVFGRTPFIVWSDEDVAMLVAETLVNKCEELVKRIGNPDKCRQAVDRILNSGVNEPPLVRAIRAHLLRPPLDQDPRMRAQAEFLAAWKAEREKYKALQEANAIRLEALLQPVMDIFRNRLLCRHSSDEIRIQRKENVREGEPVWSEVSIAVDREVRSRDARSKPTQRLMVLQVMPNSRPVLPVSWDSALIAETGWEIVCRTSEWAPPDFQPSTGEGWETCNTVSDEDAIREITVRLQSEIEIAVEQFEPYG